MLGGPTCTVLVAIAGNEIEPTRKVVRFGTLVGVAGADDRRLRVGSHFVAGAVGQEEVGGVVGAGDAGRHGECDDGTSRCEDRTLHWISLLSSHSMIPYADCVFKSNTSSCRLDISFAHVAGSPPAGVHRASRERSFIGAAHRLHISQPAISKHIAVAREAVCPRPPRPSFDLTPAGASSATTSLVPVRCSIKPPTVFEPSSTPTLASYGSAPRAHPAPTSFPPWWPTSSATTAHRSRLPSRNVRRDADRTPAP